MRLLATALLLALGGAAAPNVLFLMTDQHRADAFSAALTPSLWALGAKGLHLPRMYSSTPTCTPARSALLSGRSPWYHGMLGYGNVACNEYPLHLPSAMAARGYKVATVGKSHYYNPDCTDKHGLPPTHGWQESFLYDGLGDGLYNTTNTQEFDTCVDTQLSAISLGLARAGAASEPFCLLAHAAPSAGNVNTPLFLLLLLFLRPARPRPQVRRLVPAPVPWLRPAGHGRAFHGLELMARGSVRLQRIVAPDRVGWRHGVGVAAQLLGVAAFAAVCAQSVFPPAALAVRPARAAAGRNAGI